MIQTHEPLLVQKWPATTVAQAHAISRMTDPALRNLRITQSYHDLKIAFGHLLGSKNVTWCAYASWASRSAGRFIRGEEVPGMVRECLSFAGELQAALERANDAIGGLRPGTSLDDLFITTTIDRVVKDVTKHVGQGNLLVFQEMAPLYAAMLEAWKAPPEARDESAIDAFIASNFKPGPVGEGGQDLLIQAFRAYCDAMFEKDSATKAQQIFLANALVGYHEQTRLQGPIVDALSAPIADLCLAKAKHQACGLLPALLHSAVESAVEQALRPVAKRFQAKFNEASTRWLMTLSIPAASLQLGQDVPRLSPDRMFPEELEIATFPPLVAVLAKLDRTTNTVVGSAAKDWGDLGDRMNFIVDFFRSRQQDASLYGQPFTDEQVAVIEEGGMPPGEL